MHLVAEWSMAVAVSCVLYRITCLQPMFYMFFIVYKMLKKAAQLIYLEVKKKKNSVFDFSFIYMYQHGT